MIKKLLSLLCCLSLLLSPAGMCLAQDYKVTDQQLTRLETIFNLLDSTQQEQVQSYLEQQKLNDSLKQQVIDLQKFNDSLRISIVKTQNELNETRLSLTKANQSFETYDKQIKSEMRSLKFQRDICLLAVAVMAVKK